MKKKRYYILAALLLLLIWLKPRDNGRPYDPYFAALNQTLKQKGSAKPTLVLDLDNFDHNIHIINKYIKNKSKRFRLVTKSLPSLTLIKYVLQKTESKSVMVFHLPFARRLLGAIVKVDLLFGKPMPAHGVERFYENATNATHNKQIQWLLDSNERLLQYLAMAKRKNLRLNINIEIDVGLHRGGITFCQRIASSFDNHKIQPRKSAVQRLHGL